MGAPLSTVFVRILCASNFLFFVGTNHQPPPPPQIASPTPCHVPTPFCASVCPCMGAVVCLCVCMCVSVGVCVWKWERNIAAYTPWKAAYT